MLKPHSVQSFFVKVGVGLATLAALVTAKPWKSAEIGTTQNFKYGAFEARILSAPGSGMITTFFLWKNGSEVPGAQWQEQDFEMWGKNGLVQTQAMTPGNPSIPGSIRTEHVGVHTLPTKAWERYYTYRMEWTPKYLAYYINGTLVRKETDTVEYKKLLNPALAEPMQLRTGLWAGDYEWAGIFDSTKVPNASFVNWIQVSSYTPGTGANGSDFTPIWRDDFNSINWSRWTPSNWTFEYSISDYVTENNMIRNGTLVSAFTKWSATGTFGAAPVDDGLEPPVVVTQPAPDTTLIPAQVAATRFNRAFDLTPGNGKDAACVGINPNVDLEISTSDNESVCHISGTEPTEWLEYDVQTPTDYAASVYVRLATEAVGQTLHLELDGVKVGTSLTVPAPHGWQSFANFKIADVVIPSGIHTLRVVFETGNLNMSSLYVLSPSTVLIPFDPLPIKLGADNYTQYFDFSSENQGGAGKADGVDKEVTLDPEGGLNVAYINPGEWLQYEINLASARTYDLNIRMASEQTGMFARVLIDGVDASGLVAAPANGWQSYSNILIPGVALNFGPHVVRVVFETGGLNYRYLTITAAADVPDRVTGLVATGSDASVGLAWTSSLGATSYKVYRGTDLVGTTAATSFQDLSVVNGVEYSYTVVASNSTGDALASAPAVVTPRAPIAPDAPSALSAVAGNGIVDLTWAASANAASYKVYRSENGVDFTVLATTSNPQYLDASVLNGSTYSYRVTALNASLESAPSTVVDAAPRGVAPVQVTGLVATAGDGKVDLAWNASAGATGYTLYRSVDGSAEAVLTVVSATSYQDVAVANGSSYTYTVVASNAWGDAIASLAASATPRVLPSAPSALVAVAGNAQVSLSWTAGANDLSYNVYRAVGAAPATKIASVATPSYLDASALNGTSYTYTVTGVNGAEESAPSASVVALPKGPVPAQVTGLVATAGNATVSLVWTPAADAANYKVMRAAGAGASTLLATTTTAGYTDATVSNGTVYSYSVVASNTWGDAISSTTVTASPDFPTPAAPTALAAVAGNGTVALTWTAGANNVSFNIYRAVGAGAAAKVGTATTGVYTDATVTNGTTYTYTVKGVNGTKESPASASVTATPKGVAPVKVVGLVATPGNATVALAWTASAGATSYSVLRSVAGGASVQVGTSTTATYTDATVTNGTAYTYTVVASNVWGNAAASAAVTATPSAPTAKLKAQYKAGYVGASTNGIRPLLQIVNTGTTSVALSQVTVRYWYTKDGATAQSYWCDWAQMGQTNIVGTFKSVSPARTNADGYLELSFKTTAGNLAAGASTGEIQSRFSKSDWSNYTQTNDASYDATKSTAYGDWTKVTVYVNGTLVWGVEP
jgi:fibronectin type 3 domain-containing protein